MFMLNMKLPFFAQTVGEFLSTKTNLVALATLGFTIYGYSQGFVSYAGLMGGVSGALGAMTLRDGMKKIPQ